MHPLCLRFRFAPLDGARTDLQRTYNGIRTDLLLWHKLTTSELFLELNAKHVHEGEIRIITYCVSVFCMHVRVC